MPWLMGMKDGLAISLHSGKQATQGRKEKLISILNTICQSSVMIISWQAIFLVGGQRYRLVYIGSGMHVLIKVDESKLPSEDARGVEVENTVYPALEEPQQVSSAYSIIRLLFVSTVQSRAKNPNYRADLMLGLQDVNQIAKTAR